MILRTGGDVLENKRGCSWEQVGMFLGTGGDVLGNGGDVLENGGDVLGNRWVRVWARVGMSEGTGDSSRQLQVGL